jgi:hypothetical protein
MYKLWQGLSPYVILSSLGSFITICVLVLHFWAFNQFGWPKSLKAKYNPPVAAAVTR